MKTIIAGSRSVTQFQRVREAVEQSGFEITEVVSGTARGADRLGELWAKGKGIPVKRFPADWKFYGAAAGVKRNLQMAEYAEALIAIWDGKSPGTANMIEIAHKKKMKVFVFSVAPI